MGLFAAPDRGLRIHGQHRAAYRGPQLSGRPLPSGGQNRVLYLAGVLVAENPGEIGDEAGPGEVDDPGPQGSGRRRKSGGEVQGQLQVGVGGPPGHGQGRRHLVPDELTQLRGKTGGRGRRPVGRTAAGELGGCRQGARAAP